MYDDEKAYKILESQGGQERHDQRVPEEKQVLDIWT